MENGDLPTLARDGAELYTGAALADLSALHAMASAVPLDRAGVRLQGIAALRPILETKGAIGLLAATVLGPGTRAVRAILFDKSAAANWSLGWHQDRTICVRDRADVPGFGPWTTKSGLHHVEPPFDILARMVTLRVHLDDVPDTNAPLLIAPGSHRLGRIPVAEVEATARASGVYRCTATAGDVWMYATPILHASEAAVTPTRRRVLQVDFANADLLAVLEWTGI
ncbi:phytanoyl-CoA dioxygenase family protein [uncultured Sphingomonas sp.]|uniref:phytanoyl-CoA dioxygenase family protein n=1 Tax=uncultured Sphingomonas sp. TaxID=158754 RepID=UPI0025CE3074|nr:phytanoyl-CoA dioxygenase family protein [uncultured Sphingomonas sp.]